MCCTGDVADQLPWNLVGDDVNRYGITALGLPEATERVDCVR